VLEPDELSKRYAIAPDRRSNAGKAAAAELLLLASKRYLSQRWRLRSAWLMQSASIHTPQRC
jgi:hypothetical protein